MTADTFSPFSGSKRQVTHAHNNDPRQRITIYPKRNTRLRSFSPLMLFFVFNIILCFTGSVAWGADSSTTSTTVRETSTKTIASVAPTGTGTDEDDGDDDDDDEEGISVQGTNDLPMPFDTSIGKSFSTTTCPAFFNIFLNDADFQNCLPLSAMLQNSKSFFEITKKSGFATTRVLDVSCSVNYASCASKMEYYGREIKTPERCGTEFAKKDQLVIQAYAAFISYPALFSAGCLKSDSGSYCYVDAVTNVTNPDDPHIYFLPLGLKLPGGSRPTCSSCTQETMNIYLKDAGNSSLPLSDTYLPAAHQLNMACGPDFISTNVIPLSSSATHRASFSMVSLLTVTILLAIMFTT